MQTLSVKVEGWGEKVEVIGRNRKTVLSTQLYFFIPLRSSNLSLFILTLVLSRPNFHVCPPGVDRRGNPGHGGRMSYPDCHGCQAAGACGGPLPIGPGKRNCAAGTGVLVAEIRSLGEPQAS